MAVHTHVPTLERPSPRHAPIPNRPVALHVGAPPHHAMQVRRCLPIDQGPPIRRLWLLGSYRAVFQALNLHRRSLNHSAHLLLDCIFLGFTVAPWG